MTTEISQIELPPLSLYVHIPWCVRKCPYCDFNSHESTTIPEQDYVAALINDLDQELINVQGRQLQSIFFGGGTPSLFAEKSIATILNAVEKRIPFAKGIEITLEANPGTVERNKFTGYRSAGVNRLSIGIQSFNDLHLNELGRIHSGSEALSAVQSAKNAGFDNLNLDLMHGLPAQTQHEALADIQQAIDLGPTHISWYQLTIEPNTVFYNQPPTLPIEDELADIQDSGERLLADYGFEQYEVSAYSKNDKQCAHNLNYWQFGDYIGIGAGSHGKVTDVKTHQIERRWKSRQPKDYLNPKDGIVKCRSILSNDLPLEYLMNALRLNAGFSLDDFTASTGIDVLTIDNKITHLVQKGLLSRTNGKVSATRIGRRFLNDVIAEFQ